MGEFISDKMTKELETIFDVRIIPSKIKGRRWGCAGNNVSEFPLCPSVKIQLDNCNGYVVYEKGSLNSDQRKDLENRLRGN